MKDWILKRLEGIPRVMPVPLHWLSPRRLLVRFLAEVREVESGGSK